MWNDNGDAGSAPKKQKKSWHHKKTLNCLMCMVDRGLQLWNIFLIYI